ncbi:hypothetical protein JCM30237_01720 [Halolamina litorea]|uniref:SHOCT domain-containing protein n=1 Tax=Halolamina litorea TaxID=1515593 RepID=A0ABD6BTF3_9EURY|nr:SHOCT domain-containing protein [Halolamina litorea]
MSDSRAGESDSVAQRFRENAVGIVSTLVTTVWLGAMFTGQDWWLAALLVGYVAIVPITAMLFGDDEDDLDEWVGENWGRERAEQSAGADDGDGDGDGETALEALRRRYAEGELTDEQFERKLERLLSTETLEDVEDRSRERSVERER